MESWLLIEGVGLGALVGLVLGLTGAGGGILAVPVLVFAIGLPMQQAAPVGLLATGVGAAVGALLALRDHILRYRAAMLVAFCGMLMAPVGVWLAQRLPSDPLLLAFAAVMTYSAVRTLWLHRRGGGEQHVSVAPCVVNPAEGRLRWTLPCARALAGTGLVCGVLSGMLGVGGGFVIVPALRRFTDLDMNSIVATSLGIIALLSVGSVTSVALVGSLPWDIAVPFAGGSLLGVLLGRGLAKHIGGPRLQQGFAVLSLLVAVMLVTRVIRAWA